MPNVILQINGYLGAKVSHNCPLEESPFIATPDRVLAQGTEMGGSTPRLTGNVTALTFYSLGI